MSGVAVHLVEPGGRGGVYQHTAALADALLAEGVEVTVYTAADPEPLPTRAPRRSCLWRFSWVRPRPLRQMAIALGWLLAGLPSCVARLRPGDVVHMQGWFEPAMFVPLAVACRLRGCVLAFSPHNTFARRGRRAQRSVVAWLARRSDVTFAFSVHDGRRIEGWGGRAAAAPLALVVPPPRPELVAAWRSRWLGSSPGRVVLFAGQVRDDKGLDVLIRAAAGWDDELVLAVVGEDVGGLAPTRRLADRMGARVVWDVGYHGLDCFVAAIAAADVVACPYRRASQSAVLALARAVGRPSIATDVGGLPELATAVVPPGDPGALASAVEEVLDTSSAPGPPAPDDVATTYLDAYAVAARRRRRTAPSPPAHPQCGTNAGSPST